MGVGLYGRFLPHVLFSLWPISTGVYLLYRGIPLELREHRYKRWEKLDEEEAE